MRRRTRLVGIVPINGGYALMHRKNVMKKSIHEYYTFPGGGLEENETYEDGTKREIKEEIGIEVEIVKKLYQNTYRSEDFEQNEIYYLCKYKSGEFGTGTGPEFSNDPEYKDSGEFIPEIVMPEKLEEIILLPTEIKEKFIDDVKNGRI